LLVHYPFSSELPEPRPRRKPPIACQGRWAAGGAAVRWPAGGGIRDPIYRRPDHVAGWRFVTGGVALVLASVSRRKLAG